MPQKLVIEIEAADLEMVAIPNIIAGVDYRSTLNRFLTFFEMKSAARKETHNSLFDSQ